MKNSPKRVMYTFLLLSLLTAFLGAHPAAPALAHGPVFSPLMTVNAWSGLGSGISGGTSSVRAIAINGSDIYVAGSFTDVGGDTNADRIAKWDGSSWSALGSGISNGLVNSLAFYGSNLYVGGTFTDLDGNTSIDYIAQWDGSSWSTLGNGLGNLVNAVSVTGSDIYVAGSFLDAGGDLNADYIAKMDGGTWAAVGANPLNGTINAIAVAGSTVYAGGTFTDFNPVGNSNLSRIAMWDGSAWTALGSGLGNTVFAVTLIGSDLYVGGAFTDAGGDSAADRVAKWDGSSWSALGSSMAAGSVSVNAFAVSGSNLYIGGNFDNAGGDANADYIARWDGSAWSALGATSLNNNVNAILINGLDLYAGGAFTDAGGDANADRISLFQIDDTAPTVGSFSATSPTNSLNIPITAFTASDNIAVTGYKITESATSPATSDAGWTASAPTTYTVASSGSYTLYPWAKDVTGNISSLYGSPVSVSVDVSAPTVTAFSAPSSSTSLTISITSLTASDNVAVTGYKITESDTPPSAGAGGWTASAPTSYTVASSGSYTLYPWAKDAAGNISSVYGSPASISVDNAAPTVTAFSVPSSSSLNVPITTFTASDNVGVTGYLITESLTPPLAGAVGWTASAPDTYTVASSGAYTLYPWAKDALGNVSAVYGSPASITVDLSAPAVTDFTAPSTSDSLDIEITTFSASDNMGVTGYKITESSTPPSAGDSGWTASAPTEYTVPSSGAYTLYPWAKDAVGNISTVYGSPTAMTACVPDPITVTSSADSGAGTLRQAIAAACADVTINFDSSLSGATIRLNSTLDLSVDVTIDGSSLASQVTINGDTDNNDSGDVGVFVVDNGVTATLDGLTITKGNNGEGGGIENHGALTVRDSTISNNNGGGIKNASDAQSLMVLNSTISGNNSSVHGAGIEQLGGTMTIINSTFSGNVSSQKGGAIAFLSSAGATLVNVTISGNSAGPGGGIYFFGSSGPLNYSNTIIANNSGGDCRGIPNIGTTNVNNLVEDGDCSPALTGDPNLGPLADNGGPTQTFALLAGSIAINAGDDATCAASPVSNLDQRGVTRPADAHCDIGAYEGDFSAPNVVSIARASTNPTNAASVDFSVTFSEPVTGVDTSDFSLLMSGVSGASISGVTGAGATRTVSVNTGSGTGTIRLDLLNNGSIQDGIGNSLNGSFTSGESYTIEKTAPIVDSFTVTSPSSMSLDIPITAFTALDNVAVTGYKITESSTPPLAGAAGWTASAPTSYTVASNGSYTLYPWAKDGVGNVSAVYGTPATVSVDVTAPTVSAFTVPASSMSLSISITTFTASDNVAVAGYKVTESSTPPSAGAAGWTASAPTTFTVTGNGSHTLYPWAKDAAGNVSAVYGSPATVSVDATAPTVLSITRVTASPSAKVSVQFLVTFSEAVTGITAADFTVTKTGITGGQITGITGSGATRTITVNTGSGNGTLRLDIPNTAIITDLIGNVMTGLPFTTGQVYTINKMLTYTSTAAQDGWILESTETSGVGGSINNGAANLILGDAATKNQYRSILSFNTAGIPDNATISAVILKVRHQAIIGGGNPVTMFGGFYLEMKTGFFGTLPSLQALDFQAIASKTLGPVNAVLTSGYYNFNLINGKTAINKLTTNAGLTQIRLRFKLDDNNNALANYLSLYSGNTATVANRPQLVITYSVP